MKQTLEIDRDARADVRRSVWRHRDLRIVAPAKALSFLGDQVAVVALTLHAYDAGWGARGVAAVLVAGLLPLVVGAPLAGRLVDRYDSRVTTAGAALWQATAGFGLVAALVTVPAGPLQVAALLALVAVMGLGQAVSGPAWQTLVPHVVEPDEVPRAVSALQTTSMLGAVGGPAVGGVLVAAAGTAGALVVDAVSFLVLAAAAVAVRTVRRPGGADGGADAARSGLDVLRADRVLAALVAGLVVVVLVLQVVVVVEVLLVRGVLGAGPAGYGMVGAVLTAAMVAGSVAGGAVPAGAAQVRATVASTAAISALVVAAGLAPTLLWFAVAMAGVGLANGVLNVCLQAFVLGRTPDAVRGRVVSTVVAVVQGGTVAGMALGAAVGGALEPRAAVVASGVTGLAAAAALAAVLRVRLRG